MQCNENIIVNELLSFVCYKLNWLPPDTIVQLCSAFYCDGTVESAKALLYDRCANVNDRQDRLIKRSGTNKKKHNLDDIVSLITRKLDVLAVTFVARDLGNLPPIGFDKLDVSTLLTRLQNNDTELDLLKETVAAQAALCAKLQDIVAMQSGVCGQLTETVSSLIAATKQEDVTPVAGDVSTTQIEVSSTAHPATTPTATPQSSRVITRPKKVDTRGVSYADIVAVGDDVTVDDGRPITDTIVTTS